MHGSKSFVVVLGVVFEGWGGDSYCHNVYITFLLFLCQALVQYVSIFKVISLIRLLFKGAILITKRNLALIMVIAVMWLTEQYRTLQREEVLVLISDIEKDKQVKRVSFYVI